MSSFFDIFCDVSGTPTLQPATAAGGPMSFIIDPTANLPLGSTCTVTVKAVEVADQDGTPDKMAANHVWSFTTLAVDPCSQSYTGVYQIQGSGSATPIPGTVTTQGVVVGDYELPGGTDQIRGFYLQDPTGDGNPATSDGIFVYNGGVDTVSVGQVVRVAGTAAEFAGQTQISGPTITQCGTTGSVTPVDITLPFLSADDPERFEGMLVRFPQTLYATEHFQLGRFGQIVMTASSDRLRQPTNVVAPGAAALALQAANNLNRIIVDDEINNQNPDPIRFGRGGNPLSAANTLRGGDSVTGLVGVLAYDWAGNAASPSAYRLRPVAALGGTVPNFQAANPRPAAPSAVGGRLRVASANLLNYFNTFGSGACTNGAGGVATDCRGAETSAEFDRQWPKSVANLVGTGADVIGIMEMENDGYGAASAIQDLVTKLNNATAPSTYAFIDADARIVQTNALGTDAIKVGLIYKPAKVAPVGTTAALNSVDFVNGGDGAPRSRPALAQTFEEATTGEKFTVIVNHLKSKGSACDAPDAGDGQGNCNAVRVKAAQELTAWLATDPTGVVDSDYLIIGDLNSYAKEDPITVIKNAEYTDLIESKLGATAYSYAFDGQWGYLDHALASKTLTPQVTGVVEWHINADEPSVLDYNTNFKSAGQITSLYANDQYRSTDHDPTIIGLDLTITNDLSDLPGYGAAWHTPSGPMLGETWGAGHAAVGSGTNDGVVQTPGPTWLLSGDSQRGSVDVTVTGAPGYVTGWIDWNSDQDFEDSGEQIFVNEAFTTDGTHTVAFPIPDGVGSGKFNARFRIYPTAQTVLAHANDAGCSALTGRRRNRRRGGRLFVEYLADCGDAA